MVLATKQQKSHFQNQKHVRNHEESTLNQGLKGKSLNYYQLQTVWKGSFDALQYFATLSFTYSAFVPYEGLWIRSLSKA